MVASLCQIVNACHIVNASTMSTHSHKWGPEERPTLDNICPHDIIIDHQFNQFPIRGQRHLSGLFTFHYCSHMPCIYCVCIIMSIKDFDCDSDSGLNECWNIVNKMYPRHFPLAATALKPQQIPMFLHISARVWGRGLSPHTSEQKGSALKPQQFINQNACAAQIAHTRTACL